MTLLRDEPTVANNAAPQNSDRPRRRVLLYSEDLNPDWPSLPIVAYNTAVALAKQHDVTLVTHVRNRKTLAEKPIEGAMVEYVSNEYVAKPLFKLTDLAVKVLPFGQRLYVAAAYPSTLALDRAVWKRYGKRITAGEFEVVHKLTPMSPTLPSPLAKWVRTRSNTPFVLGPLNGGLKWKSEFAAEQAREREGLSLVRRLSATMPYYRSTYANCAAVLAAFRHTIDDLPDTADGRVINFPEVGVDPARFAAPPTESTGDRKTIIFAGRLVPYKLPEVVVRAAVENPILRQHRILIVGDGEERPRLEKIVADNDLGDCVGLTGKLPQAEVAKLMRESDIFAFPSIRELGAGVVVEAMGCGLACVVVDYGGPADLIDETRGIKVPIAPTDALVKSFAVELGKLVADPARLRDLGKAAREHALRHYTWDAKAAVIGEVYDWVLGEGERPDFWAD